MLERAHHYSHAFSGSWGIFTKKHLNRNVRSHSLYAKVATASFNDAIAVALSTRLEEFVEGFERK